MNKNERNMSLDVLRIIAMIMIVMLHYLGKGGALESTNRVTYITGWLIEAFCIIAVNVYVLISGYFLVDSTFKWKKVFKIWGQVLFYSVLFFLVSMLLGKRLNTMDTVSSFFPITTRTGYWFMTTYIFLYILSPFLNIMIKNLSQKMHLRIILISALVFSVVGSFLPADNSLDSTCGTGIIWFVILYIIAAYIKLYGLKLKGKKCIIIYIMASILICSSKMASTYIFRKFGIPMEDFSKFYTYNSIVQLVSAVSLFIFFKDIDIKNNILKKSVKFIAPLTLGVYLIHDNFLVRRELYNGIFDSYNYTNKNIFLFITISVGSVILIFSVCIIIEYIRVTLFTIMAKTKAYSIIENKCISFGKKLNKKIDGFVK